MKNLEIATLGAGCFWCVEAIFQDLNGVEQVLSGYTGGQSKNPTYKEICSGLSGHAEVIQITFNPEQITFKDLLEIFFVTHNPTTLNQQGADKGTQYRSAIFYHNDSQKEIAQTVLKETTDKAIWPDPIVTEISPATEFYTAETYHQNYYKTNPMQGYCRIVIEPKVQKFRKEYYDKLKA